MHAPIAPASYQADCLDKPSFRVLSRGSTRARTGALTLGSRIIETPVIWLGHSLKSRVRANDSNDTDAASAPILLNFAEFRRSPAALHRARLQGLHSAFEHCGPILLDSGGFQFQRAARIDLSAADLLAFYADLRADISVALDHPLSPSTSRRTNARRWQRSLQNLAAMGCSAEGSILMPVIHGYTLGQVRRCCERIEALIGTPSIVGIGSLVPLLKASHIGGRFRYRRSDGSIGDHVDFVLDVIGTVRTAFPSAMLHVFGAGGVPTILALIGAGADSCDSAAWRLKASYGAIQLPGTSDRFLWTKRNSSRSRRVIDAHDIKAISECECSACRSIKTVAGRRSLLGDSFSARAIHNAHVILTEIRSIRAEIRAGTDLEWIKRRLSDTHRFWRLVGMLSERYA